MNCRKIYRPAAVLMLSAAIVGTTVTPAFAAQKNTQKEENVYVNLKEDGSVDGVYVVNAYDLKKDQKVLDYGDYTAVENLSTDNKIKVNGEKITVEGEEGKFYYQGDLDAAQIPWKIEIEYQLDGKKISPQSLAGKSGYLKIKIHIGKNKEADQDFFEHFLLQATLTLDTEKCKNIKAEGATAANSGKNKQLTYNILARQEKDLTIQTDVKNFQMDPITINGVPMSFDIDLDQMDTSALTEKTGELEDGVKALNEGAQKTDDGADTMKNGLNLYQQGIDTLYAGADTLFAGAKQADAGIEAYTSGVDQAAAGNRELEQKTKDLPKLMKGLTAACKQLQTGSADLADEKTWTQIENGMKQIKEGLANMEKGLQQIDSQGIKEMKKSLEGNGELKSGMESLQAGIKGAESYVSKLSSVSETYDNQAEQLKQIIEKESTNSSDQSGSNGQTKTQTKTQEDEGEYQTDRTETSKETTTDENGNTVVTITNNIYQTRTNTVTNTVTNETTKTEKAGSQTEELSSLYQSMKKNSAQMKGILDGSGSTAGLKTILKQCSSGADQIAKGLYGNEDSLDSGLTDLQKVITDKNGLTEGVDALIEGVDAMEQALYGSKAQSIKTGALSLHQGMGTLYQSTVSVLGEVNQLASAIKQLSEGTSRLSAQSSSLKNGGEELLSGAKAVRDGSGALSSNIVNITDGASQLKEATSKLSQGTQTLEEQTSGMDNKILDGIEEELGSFSGEDYKVKSFVSSKNSNVKSVQFVMKTDGIKKKEKKSEEKTKKKETLLDKIKGLFS